MRPHDLRTLRRADVILTEMVRNGVELAQTDGDFTVIRRLHGWTRTLLIHEQLSRSMSFGPEPQRDMAGEHVALVRGNHHVDPDDVVLVRAASTSACSHVDPKMGCEAWEYDPPDALDRMSRKCTVCGKVESW